MFNIFKSNRMENLMTALARSLAGPVSDPMRPEWIGVQSRGMKQWITACLADEFGVCANTRYMFPKQIIETILDTSKPDDAEKKPVNAQFVFWSVLDRFMEKDLPGELNRVRQYIRSDPHGKKKIQLAKQIAGCFDDYLVYRPELLLNWSKSTDARPPSDPDMVWQEALWRTLTRDHNHHFAFQVDAFLKAGKILPEIEKKLPSRISFFGISVLPPLFLKVFEKLAQVININMFVLTASDAYFFDIQSTRQKLKADLKAAAPKNKFQSDASKTDPGGRDEFGPADGWPGEEINPVMASFSASGRAFFSFLETVDYHEPLPDLFQDPLPDQPHMLAVLQSDIFSLAKRGGSVPKASIRETDRSVSIHSCHSPMREAQILKDLLIEAFETQPDLSAHDVIVMMPDIEAYAPFIESVFSLEHGLPFTISDRKKRSESQFIEAFLKILSLFGERLSRQQVLDLLSYESVRKKFGINASDILDIEKIVSDAKILWAKDGAHRKSLGLPDFEENTWIFGLDRLFMGMTLPEETDHAVLGVSPCESWEGPQLERLGKLARFCHTLFDCLESLRVSKTIEKWTAQLHSICDQMLAPSAGSAAEDVVFLYQVLKTIEKDAAEAGFRHKIGFEMMQTLFEEQVDQNISQGSFLAGRMTFCNIMPMRSIPYRIVVLMGMDESAFPRQTPVGGFHLMRKFPKFGDKNERDDDRYLFLETLLSARDRLIITYTGQSIADNSPIPCSGAVSELEDVIQESFEFPENFKFKYEHRLHSFHTDYFRTGSHLFSYSADNARLARAMADPDAFQNDGEVFFKSPADFSNQDKNKDLKPIEISMEDLIRFFRHPVRWLMQKTFNIGFPEIGEEQNDREHFNISGLDRFLLGQRLFDRHKNKNGFENGYPAVKATGNLPFGKKGETEFRKLVSDVLPLVQKAQSLMTGKELKPYAATIQIDECRVQTNLSGIYPQGLILPDFGALSGARLLKAWIHHVFLNLTAPDGHPKKTVWIGRDPEKKKKVLTAVFEPLETDAMLVAQHLVCVFLQGRENPVPFFCETSYQFANFLAKQGFPDDEDRLGKALKAARKRWVGNMILKGEKEDRYIEECFGKTDPLDAAGPVLKKAFARFAIDIYKPMLGLVRVE